MKALVLEDDSPKLVYKEVPTPEVSDQEVLVAIKAAALNHRDVWISKGMYPGIYYPCIMGSDGAGLVDGREVILNPSLNWGSDQRYQGKDYSILGLPEPGTFASHIKIPKENIVDKPSHLNWEQAAALPLAGLTAYRALFSRAQLQTGERVLISGIGGGVALFAFQFALAAGAEVYVTSSSAEKIARAVAMGAAGGANYTEENWAKPFGKASGGFDVIIDSAGGPGFSNLLKVAKPGGRIAIYGGTRGNVPKFSPQLVFWKQLSIFGTTMGSTEEFIDMVAFVNTHQIVPIIDSSYSMEDAAAAFEKMNNGKQFGKIILIP